jgi:DNA replication protein DnaC
MHIEALLAMLKQLKLYGMRQSVQDLSLQNAPAWQHAQPMLETLLKAEVADREVRSVAYQMSAARFPAYRDLYGFNFAESEVDERLVQDLHRCEFIQSSQNLVFVGGPGTGKTHLATAIGVQAIQHHGLRVRFISTLELVNALELEKRKDQCGRIAARLSGVVLWFQNGLKRIVFNVTNVHSYVHMRLFVHSLSMMQNLQQLLKVLKHMLLMQKEKNLKV